MPIAYVDLTSGAVFAEGCGFLTVNKQPVSQDTQKRDVLLANV